MTLIDLANPTKFLSLTARVLPWLAGATAILLLIGFYQAAMAPDDYQHGAVVKIMFIHVPNAWLSMFVWSVMSLAALGTLVWRHPLADVAAKAAAPIGAAFTFLALVTGSLCGALAYHWLQLAAIWFAAGAALTMSAVLALTSR